MLSWEHFWYIQSVVADCNGTFLIFNTFLTFPWTWLATLNFATLLRLLSGGQKIFGPLLYEIPMLSFLQLVCFRGEKMGVVFVAEGLNAVLMAFAYGYVNDEVFLGSRALLNLALRACVSGWEMQLVMWSLAGKQWRWGYEIMVHVVSGVGLMLCGMLYRLMHAMLGLRRRRLELEQVMDEMRRLMAQAAQHNAQE